MELFNVGLLNEAGGEHYVRIDAPASNHLSRVSTTTFCRELLHLFTREKNRPDLKLEIDLVIPYQFLPRVTCNLPDQNPNRVEHLLDQNITDKPQRDAFDPALKLPRPKWTD